MMRNLFRHAILAAVMALLAAPAVLAASDANRPLAVFTGQPDPRRADYPAAKRFEDVRVEGQLISKVTLPASLGPALELQFASVSPGRTESHDEVKPAFYKALPVGAEPDLQPSIYGSAQAAAVSFSDGRQTLELLGRQFHGVFNNSVRRSDRGAPSGDWRTAGSWDVPDNVGLPGGQKYPSSSLDAVPAAMLASISGKEPLSGEVPARMRKMARLAEAPRWKNTNSGKVETPRIVLASLNPAVRSDPDEDLGSLSAALKPPRLQPAPVTPGEGRKKQSSGGLSIDFFLDQNGDGNRQLRERGLPVSALSAASFHSPPGGEGMVDELHMLAPQEGVFAVDVKSDALPLGYQFVPSWSAAVQLGPDRPARLPVPVEVRGQVRGSVFLDVNSDGQADPEDHWLEAESVQLIANDGSNMGQTSSAAFGQYGFDGLPPGQYHLRVAIGWQEHLVAIEITGRRPFQVVPIAVSPGRLKP